MAIGFFFRPETTLENHKQEINTRIEDALIPSKPSKDQQSTNRVEIDATDECGWLGEG